MRVITVAVATYPNQPTWDVTLANASRDNLSALFRDHGATVVDWSEPSDHDTLRRRLDEFSRRDDAAVDEDTSHVFYWTGHGEDTGEEYLLATGSSRSPLPDHDPISDYQLHKMLRDEARRPERDGSSAWTLLIIDACSSGIGSRRIDKRFPPDRPAHNVGIIGTTEDGSTLTGRFYEVFERMLTTGWDNESRGIGLAELVNRLSIRLGPKIVHHTFDSDLVLARSADMLTDIVGTIDIQNELKLVLSGQPDAVRHHFFRKAQGTELNELAWYFKGRERERRDINEWLEDADSGMFIVTGVAGIGKSALLGMVLASTYPELMKQIRLLGRDVDHIDGADIAPEDVAFDAVVHLSGIDFRTALAQTADTLQIDYNDDVDTFFETLTNASHNRRTIMFDALDESHDPFTIGTGLLRRLAGISGVRVLVGTRRSLGEDPDNPETTSKNLIAALQGGDDTRLIELEPDNGAVNRYTRERLRKHLPDHDSKMIHVAAKRISDAGQPFLFARLAVHEISRDPDRFLTLGSEAMNQLVVGSHVSIFRHAVDRLRRDQPRVEALLHALAYAFGNGFPRSGGVWAKAGTAIYGDHLDDQDIEDAITVAAPYILRDTEFGYATYRLAHRTFTEHYLKQDRAEIA